MMLPTWWWWWSFLAVAWAQVLVHQQLDSNGGDVGVFSSVVASSNGLPIVAYTRLTSVPGVSELRLLVCLNLGCSQTAITTVVAAGAGQGWYPSACLMEDGVHVAISYATTSTVSIIVCNSSSGACTQPAGGGNLLAAGLGAPGWTSVALVSGNIAVAFSASNSTHSVVGYALCTDQACSSMGSSQILYAASGANLLNWGSDRILEHPYLVFYQDGRGLVLLRCLDKACTPSAVVSVLLDAWQYGQDVGLYPSLILDSIRLPRIVYHDASNLQVKLFVCLNEACDSRVSRAYPSTHGWDPKLVVDSVSGFLVVVYGDAGDNQTSLMLCGDPTCDPAMANTVSMARGQAERFGVVSSRFYRPAVVSHGTWDHKMHLWMYASDPACLNQTLYPCLSSLTVSFTNPAVPYLVTNATSIHATGTVQGIANTSGLIMTGGFSLQQDGTFSGTVELLEGVNVVTATVTNGTAALGAATVTIVSDRDPPVVTILSPKNGTVVYEASVIVTGTVEDKTSRVVGVYIGSLVSATAQPQWSFLLPLPINQTTTFNVTAKDEAGNIGWQTITLTQGGLDPRLLCPPNQVIECGIPAPQASGVRLVNCLSTVVRTDSFSASCGAAGLLSRTFTAPACSPLPAPCVQEIQFLDRTFPVIICPAPLTLDCSATVGNTVLPNATLGPETPVCGPAATITSSTPLPLTCGVNQTRIFVATDACSKTASCSQYISIAEAAPTTTPAPPPSGLSPSAVGGLIAGIIVLGIILLASILALCVWKRRQKRRESNWSMQTQAFMDEASVHTSDLFVDNPNKGDLDIE